MCTQEETAEILREEFWKKGGLKDQLTKEVHAAIDARVGRWFISGGAIIVFMVAAGWFSLSNSVANNTQKIDDALTSDQAALIIQRLDQLETTVQEKNRIIERLDERLRSKGI